jgi:hypothetical protein
MKRCRFIDADATIFKPGTNEWLPGVKEVLKKWSDAGDMLFMFTLRPLGLARPWLEILQAAGIKLSGYLQKPLADEYYVYDDHLVEGRQSICCPHAHLVNSVAPDAPTKVYCKDCDIYLYDDEYYRSIFK